MNISSETIFTFLACLLILFLMKQNHQQKYWRQQTAERFWIPATKWYWRWIKCNILVWTSCVHDSKTTLSILLPWFRCCIRQCLHFSINLHMLYQTYAISRWAFSRL